MLLTRLKTIMAGVLAVGVLGVAPLAVHAGCGGGCGGSAGSAVAGHRFAGYARGSAGCCGGSGGMAMSGMAMSGMNMAAYAPPAVAPAAPAPAVRAAITPRPLPGAAYTCSMHPSVVSQGPGACPYCGMALTRR